jgi:hypothetical protein
LTHAGRRHTGLTALLALLQRHQRPAKCGVGLLLQEQVVTAVRGVVVDLSEIGHFRPPEASLVGFSWLKQNTRTARFRAFRATPSIDQDENE